MTTFYSYTSTDQAQAPVTWDCLCFNNGSITLEQDATYGEAFKAVIGPGDRNPWNGSAPSNDASGQVSKGRPNDLGRWDWYSTSVKVPSAGWLNPDWSTILSVGYETLQGDQVAVGIAPMNGAPTFELYQNSGLLTNNGSGWYAGTVTGDTALFPVKYDTWIDFVVGVKWATDSTGAVEVYTRLPGAAWAHTLERLNEPTAAYGSTPYGTVDANLSQSPTVLDKVGLYYGYWSATRTSFPDETVWLTGFARSADLAAAESAF